MWDHTANPGIEFHQEATVNVSESGPGKPPLPGRSRAQYT